MVSWVMTVSWITSSSPVILIRLPAPLSVCLPAVSSMVNSSTVRQTRELPILELLGTQLKRLISVSTWKRGMVCSVSLPMFSAVTAKAYWPPVWAVFFPSWKNVCGSSVCLTGSLCWRGRSQRMSFPPETGTGRKSLVSSCR